MTSVAVSRTRTVRRRVGEATRRAGRPRREPWRGRDVLALAVVGTIALAGMVAGWVGVSGTVRLATQARWLGLGIGSLILAGFAMVGWLMVGMLRIAALRRELVATLTARTAAGPAAGRRLGTSTVFGTAPGMRHYHRPECPLLVAKQVAFSSPGDHAAAGRAPCGICAPEPTG